MCNVWHIMLDTLTITTITCYIINILEDRWLIFVMTKAIYLLFFLHTVRNLQIDLNQILVDLDSGPVQEESLQ